MNPYQLMIPQLLAGLAIVVIALRAVRQARRDNETHKAEVERRRAELNRYVAQLDEAAANPGLPASAFVTEWSRPPVLRVTLSLTDPDSVADVARVARETERLITGLSNYDVVIGGRGLTLIEAKAEPGRVVLTLSSKDNAGATERVRRVADAINAAFDSNDRTPGDPVPELGTLPADVSAARAVPLAV